MHEQLTVARQARVQINAAQYLLDYFDGQYELVLKVRVEQTNRCPKYLNENAQIFSIGAYLILMTR